MYITRGKTPHLAVNGTDHAAQSSGETDIRLLRSNKTHAELLVVYDRLPNTPDKSGTRLWNGTKTQVWAMRLVVRRQTRWKKRIPGDGRST